MGRHRASKEMMLLKRGGRNDVVESKGVREMMLSSQKGCAKRGGSQTNCYNSNFGGIRHL